MNEMIEKIITRHAIRKFQDKQVEEEALGQILQAGLYAPSAGNNQYSRIVVCQDQEVNLRLGRLNRSMDMVQTADPKKIRPVSAEQPSIRDDLSIKDAFYGAPTVLTIFVRGGYYAHEDVAFMAENMWLAAHFLGLGACYIGRAEKAFDTDGWTSAPCQASERWPDHPRITGAGSYDTGRAAGLSGSLFAGGSMGGYWA